MRFLLDTHVLLWAAGDPRQLSAKARRLLGGEENVLMFSPASIWEVAIKRSLGRSDFVVEPRPFRRGLLENGYEELPIRSEHAVAINELPAIHRDPFDRMLIAQSLVEGLTLLTSDPLIARYPGSIHKV